MAFIVAGALGAWLGWLVRRSYEERRALARVRDYLRMTRVVPVKPPSPSVQTRWN